MRAQRCAVACSDALVCKRCPWKRALGWPFSVDTGLVGNSSPVYLDSAEPFLPGICKELISSSLELLGQSDDEEGTVADSLMSNFLRIHDGVLAVSRAHEEQDEDSQCSRKRPHRPACGDRRVLRVLRGMAPVPCIV